jgi:NAD(P)-dependent dehydrogenase (short-subunit alcohol dehydrogenase family)
MDIKGAVALIAGGGGGFGAATARRLHAAGARVVVSDLDEAKGRAVTDELGDGAVFVRTDVTDSGSVQQAIDAAAQLGPLRIAVVAHGGPGGQRTLDKESRPAPQESFANVVGIFLEATYNIDRLAAAAIAATEPLEHGERGVIINTASIAAYDGTIGQAAYAAAKGGIVSMTLPLARDLAPVGIRVVTIAPGTFLTPAFRNADPEQLDAYWGAAVPFPKRMGRAGEYAQLAQQIAENVYLNGETIRLDGALRFTPKGAR